MTLTGIHMSAESKCLKTWAGSMEDEIQKVEQVAKKGWPVVMSWVGGITALLVLFASLAGGIAWFVNHPGRRLKFRQRLLWRRNRKNRDNIQLSFKLTRWRLHVHVDPLS